MDAKTTYAKSSDIKGKTYLEYRRDMKRKAIAELEMLVFLPEILKEELKTESLVVKKWGGVRFLWFLRKGGITREPDFLVEMDKQTIEVEFQYAKKTDLNFYDFKVSKVARVKQKKPIENKYFFYLNIPLKKYAFFDTRWVIGNSNYGMVEAWRSYAYRVPKENMEKILKEHSCLSDLIQNIEAKETLLNFQYDLLDKISKDLSFLFQQVIDEKKILNFIPDNLDSIFRICFIRNAIGKIPQNVNLWIVYLLTYVHEKNTLSEIYKIVYSLDFLYSVTENLKENEINCIVNGIKQLMTLIQNYFEPNGFYTSSPKESPYNEAQYSIFAMNLLEDIIQDLIYNYEIKNLQPIRRIFENLNDFRKTYNFIKGF